MQYHRGSMDKLIQIIEKSVISFDKTKLKQSCLELLKVLGYQSDRLLEGVTLTSENMASVFSSEKSLNPERAKTADWKQIHFLFQLTEEDFSKQVHELNLYLEDNKYQPGLYQSYLFFALELSGTDYCRTDLANITREINKLLNQPALVIFTYEQKLTLSIIHRRPNKEQIEKDVLEKVTLIKDIDLLRPNRGHLDILEDFSLSEIAFRSHITNIENLYERWKVILDTSTLNKNFYKEISDWYFWAMPKVKFPLGAGSTRRVPQCYKPNSFDYPDDLCLVLERKEISARGTFYIFKGGKCSQIDENQ